MVKPKRSLVHWLRTQKDGRLLMLTPTVLTHLSFTGGTPLQKSNSTKISLHSRAKRTVHTSLGTAKPSDQLHVVVCCICLSLSTVHRSPFVSFRGLGLAFRAVTVEHKEYHGPVSQWALNFFWKKFNADQNINTTSLRKWFKDKQVQEAGYLESKLSQPTPIKTTTTKHSFSSVVY